jgi:hypothetical protein
VDIKNAPPKSLGRTFLIALILCNYLAGLQTYLLQMLFHRLDEHLFPVEIQHEKISQEKTGKNTYAHLA